MITEPDIYKIIDKSLKEKMQYDLENNLIPDWQNIDLQQAEKIAKTQYLAIIERLINKCQINDNYEKSQGELKKYTTNYIEKNYPLMNPATIFNILENYKNNELGNILHPQVQAFILYVELNRVLYFYIQEKYIKKAKNDLNVMLTHYFLEYSLELLNSISTLLLGKNNNSVISVYRTFYENHIVFSYLQKHSELINAFIDHAKIDECVLKMEYAKIKKKDIEDTVKETYKNLISKYGENFKENYGWTNNLMSEKSNINLKTMFEEIDLGEKFIYYYKLACKYTHSTAFSLMVRPKFNEIIRFLYGIAEIMNKEFEAMFCSLKFKNAKEKELLKHWCCVTTNNLIKTLRDAGI